MTTIAVPILSKADAKRLTRRIKTTGEVLWALLAEAHEGQAWKVLGHSSWRVYCETEFGMNERTAFRVLDQGKVAKALTAAANEPVEVSQRQAAAVKPHLPEAVERIEAGEAPAQVVREIAKSPWPPSANTRAEPPAGDSPTAITYPQDPTAEPTVDQTEVGDDPAEAHPSAAAVAQVPAPREAGEEVAASSPLAATSDPVQPENSSGGEGGPDRAKRASLSAGPSPVLSPTELAKAMVSLTANDWKSISTGLVGQLSSACRKRLGVDAPVAPPAMRSPRRVDPPKSLASPKKGCAAGKHPEALKVGRACEACGDKRAWAA